MDKGDIMITLYSGTPGSGKSLHVNREIMKILRSRKKAVISNSPVNMDVISRKGRRRTGEFVYLTNDKLTVDYLIGHAKKHHKVGREGQTLVVIDEAAIMFNARDYASFDRKAWLNFFMTHRHYGYNVIMVAQSARQIDRQIRDLIEYEVKHRKANNFKAIGLLFTLFGIPLFVAVTYWYGINEKCGAEFFRYRKKDGKMYDTMMLFGGEDHGDRIGETKEVPEEIETGPDGDGVPAPAGGSPLPAGPSMSRQEAEEKMKKMELLIHMLNKQRGREMAK
jgi:zona occludens toxin (predicted ATPase)